MNFESFLLVHEDAVAHAVIALFYDCRRRQFAREAKADSEQRRSMRDAEAEKFRADYLKVQQEARAEWARMFSIVN